jgi:hypothetical protein
MVRHRNANRYYNPPEEVPRLGRVLSRSTFDDMAGQLLPAEVLMAFASPYGTHDAAVHVTDETRLLEIERDWHVTPTYYAVNVRKLLGGLSPAIPERELSELLDDDPDAEPL